MDRRYRQKVWYETRAVALLVDYGQKYGMITSPPVPFDLILEQHLGYTLHILDIQHEFGVGGVAAVIPSKKVLVVDVSCVDTPMYSFSIGHEIGHIVLHENERLLLRTQRQVICSHL